jgi:hypothetical protein
MPRNRYIASFALVLIFTASAAGIAAFIVLHRLRLRARDTTFASDRTILKYLAFPGAILLGLVVAAPMAVWLANRVERRLKKTSTASRGKK